ncbi:hypothetical protein [Salinisphaera sp. G21_0]|uniref:hypothetical protein n=1 Tax=Salinisphaera sp. G21_0 TaxID=2821094 RepID=UPI001ADC28A9|nr:hypothetical protein [Salinisphaera sp. G21_0]MBO9484327.1 hypothetical protein [Salinisphaera sp. G21_0]
MKVNPRIVLLPFMSVFELALIAICYLLAFISVKWAIKINDWSKRLPELDWYT